MAFVRKEVRKKKPGPGWWSEKTRMEVVTAFVVLGKVSLVVATTGVPEDTIRKWKMAPWWKEAEDEIRRASKLSLSGKLQDVVARTFTALEDRVANGDYIYDSKLGTFVRKPINAIVANKIINDMIDKSILLEKEATKDKITEDGIQQRLDKLREEFKSFARGRPKLDEKDIIDISPIAVRQLPSSGEGLQHPTNSGGYAPGGSTPYTGNDTPSSGPSSSGASGSGGEFVSSVLGTEGLLGLADNPERTGQNAGLDG